jgi:hypothetical protein
MQLSLCSKFCRGDLFLCAAAARACRYARDPRGVHQFGVLCGSEAEQLLCRVPGVSVRFFYRAQADKREYRAHIRNMPQRRHARSARR